MLLHFIDFEPGVWVIQRGEAHIGGKFAGRAKTIGIVFFSFRSRQIVEALAPSPPIDPLLRALVH